MRKVDRSLHPSEVAQGEKIKERQDVDFLNADL